MDSMFSGGAEGIALEEVVVAAQANFAPSAAAAAPAPSGQATAPSDYHDQHVRPGACSLMHTER